MYTYMYVQSFKGDSMQNNTFQTFSKCHCFANDAPWMILGPQVHKSTSCLWFFPWENHQYDETEFKPPGCSPGSWQAWLVVSLPCPIWRRLWQELVWVLKGGRQGALHGNWSKSLNSQVTKGKTWKVRAWGILGTQNILDVRICPDFSKVCF